MTDEPAGVVTSTAQDELRSVLIFTSYIGATYWIPVSDEMSHSDLEIIINLLGTYANNENRTDKISPKFGLKWKKFSENSLKMANFHLILAKIWKIST